MIVLVNPPNPPNAVSNKDTMGGLGQLYSADTKIKIPPLDIPYVAAVLRREGVAFSVFDCLGLGWGLDELMLRLLDERPEFIAIRTSTPTIEWDMRLAGIIKKELDTKVIIFGSHVAFCAEKILSEPCVDAVILGEPEFALLDIVKRGGFIECQGVWYRQDNIIVKNKSRILIDDLDKLPHPAWDLLPYHAYDAAEIMNNLKPFVTALTSRGCPFGCTYCPYPVTQGLKLRVRSPESVVDELGWLVNDLGVRAVLFRDPELALFRDRIVSICEKIVKRGLRIAWRCETRMEDLDEELIALMAKAGCIGINAGIENADERVLQNAKRKPLPLARAVKIIKSCKKNRIKAFCFFILGLPGETKSSALKTINYALKLNLPFVQFTVATPYPGTALRAWAQNNGFIENDSLSALTGYEVVMRNEHMTSEEIRRIQRFAGEALEMRWDKIIRRILKDFRNIPSELMRWLRFEKEKFFLKTEIS